MLQTPYYLIDESALLRNMLLMQRVRELSGAKCLLALKCFAGWSVFPLMQQYMDGTTSSSLYEVKLGYQKFGGETHAYSVAYAPDEIDEVIANCDKIIFNTIGQLDRYAEASACTPRGIRVNPGVSSSSFLLADPARPFSRLGEWDPEKIRAAMDRYDHQDGQPISGFMFHNNCENGSLERFSEMLTVIEERFGALLHRVQWVSLGGGIHFTGDGYPLEDFCSRLKSFSERYGVQVYLEPGEAAITRSASLEVTVLDVLENGKKLAIVDASTEAHMLDLLIYRLEARLEDTTGDHAYLVCGKSCLAGDIFGEFHFPTELKAGDRLSFADAAGYTMVKKNWFNGLKMPSIAVKRLSGDTELVREFGYDDFMNNLS